jgi:DNA-binding NtrC family response regulator
MPDTLMESELFGHEKGSFTGAVERRLGCFELAQNGTLLLDEIGDMPLTTQAKLLRVLEDGRVRRLGGKVETQLDVRVLASTNAPLDANIRDGKFREDLYYRLNVFPIPIPPLRDHKEDLQVLMQATLEAMNKKHATKVTDLSPAVLERFQKHSWPGNVRELRNVVERAVILAGEGTIEPAHLPPGFAGAPVPAAASISAEELLVPVGYTIEQTERALIEMTLEYTKNNRTRAAEILGISQKTLFNKLKEYGTQGTT